jgi:hypothetical protein
VLCRDVPTAFQYCVVSSLTLRLSCLKFQTDCGITGTSTLPKVSWSMVSELRANLGRTFLNITAAVALLMATSVSLFSRTYQTKPTPGGLILANPACLLFWRLFEDGGGGTRSSVARTVSSALSGVRCMDASKEPSWSPFHSFSSVVFIGSNECGWSSKCLFFFFFPSSLKPQEKTTNHFCNKCSPCHYDCFTGSLAWRSTLGGLHVLRFRWTDLGMPLDHYGYNKDIFYNIKPGSSKLGYKYYFFKIFEYYVSKHHRVHNFLNEILLSGNSI